MAGDFLQGVLLGMALHRGARSGAGTGAGSYTSVRDAWDHSRRMGLAVGAALAAEGLCFPDDAGAAAGGSAEEDETAAATAAFRINDFLVTAGAETLAPGFSLPRLIVRRAAAFSNVCEASVAPADGGVLIRAGQRFELFINTANASGLLRGMETNGITLRFDPGDPPFTPPGRAAPRLDPDTDGRRFGALGLMANGSLTAADHAVTLKGRPLRDVTVFSIRFFLAAGAGSSAGITFGPEDFYLKRWEVQ